MINKTSKENINKPTYELLFLNKKNTNINKKNLNHTLKDNKDNNNNNKDSNDSMNQKYNSIIDNNIQKLSSSQNEIVNQKK